MLSKSFARNLFFLFLLFAIIPAVILTLFGYYLLNETGSPTDSERIADPEELTAYFNDYLFDRLETGLDNYLASARVDSLFLDFLFKNGPGGLEILQHPDLLTPELIDDIIATATDRPRGFIESGRQYYQFTVKKLPGGETVYAGLVHDLQHKALMDMMQSDHASLSTRKTLQKKYLFFLASLFGILAVLTVVTAYVFSRKVSRNIARPMSELSEASREIATGNFKPRITPAGQEEIKTLIENFNLMASQLEEITARLAQTERVAAWRQVARRFAHELKNPLQPMLISLYRIEKQLIDTPAYDSIYEPLKAASEELKHLTGLAERFSHLAKLPPPQREEINLNALINSIADLYRDRLAGYRFEKNLPAEEIVTLTDAAYLREALHNLLQNAIDASSGGDRIILKLEREFRKTNISVTDFGEGMNDTIVRSARLPYFTTKDHGTGLGLAIVEKSVNELNGQLLIESQSGYGTTVTIVLPDRE
ncbi:MAG: ATP-binding protein [Candidatus Zixiibacteriota bacterium]